MDPLCRTNTLTELKNRSNVVTNIIKLFLNFDIVLTKIYCPKRILINIIGGRYLNSNRFMIRNTQIVLHIKREN